MKIKGTAVKITSDFVKDNHPNRYKEWFDSLPYESKTIIGGTIIETEWYPLSEAVIIPTKKIGELFFNGNEQEAAMELGRESAETGLKGIYKIFVMISSPSFMLSRAKSIFSTFYEPSEISVINTSKNSAEITIDGIDENDKLAAWRIAGWMERSFVITNRKNVQTRVNCVNENDTFRIIINLSWE